MKLTLGDRLRRTNHVDIELTVFLDGATPLAAGTAGRDAPGRVPGNFSSALGMG